MGKLLRFVGGDRQEQRVPSTSTATLPAAPARGAATEEDRRALRVYLDRRGDGESGVNAARTLNRLARTLGYTDAEHCPWSQLDYDDCQMIVDDLRPTCTPESINATLSVLRGLAARAKKARIAKHNPDAWEDVLAFEPLSCSALPPAERERVSRAEYAALLAACDADATEYPERALRDKCLVMLLWFTGLRVATVCALQLSSLLIRKVDENGVTVVKWFIRVVGQVRAKRHKEHLVLLDPDLVVTLEQYLDLRGRWAGPLLVSTSVGRTDHHLLREGIGRRSITYLLAKLCEKANIDMRSSHSFRRAFVTELITAGGVRAAQVAVGHSSLSQTALYDTEGHRRMEDAITARHRSMTGGG